MKKFILIIAAISLIGCATQAGQVKGPPSSLIGLMPEDDRKMPVVHLYALDDYMRGVMKSQGKDMPLESESSRWTIPVGMATVEPRPAVQSLHHQNEIDQSKRLYDEGKYIDAANAVHEALKDEPENEFILECYARALYRTDTYRPESFELYRRLISLLDSKDQKSTIALNSWFMEAYWKYGTLFMDRRDWERAAFEMSRALAISFSLNDPQPFALQAYSYLTKAYYQMGRYDVARYYADAALQINPKNEYVKFYLDQIERKKQ
jgi:tetratricopeptide (TPR) repeat protein